MTPDVGRQSMSPVLPGLPKPGNRTEADNGVTLFTDGIRTAGQARLLPKDS